jgi:hypothetical protein
VPLGRTRAALLTGALLVATLPFTASAIAPHLTCGPKQVGRWESIPIRDYQPVSGLTPQPQTTAYTVDRVRPQDVAVTNGQRVQISHSNGCDWENAVALDPAASASQPFVGNGSSIVSLALLQGTGLAAVRSSTGAPHVLRFDGQSWTTSDSGLPPAGIPRLLRAAGDGRTAYLTISPTATGGSDDGTPDTPVPLPTLPTLPPPVPGNPAGTPTGFLYATTDGGATWSLRTGAGDLPNGGTGFSALEVDPRNANWLYGIVNGKLLTSKDGGATFTTVDGSGYTAMAPLFYGALVAFDGAGHGVLVFGGRVIMTFAAPKGITSAAVRADDSMVMVESSGALRMVGAFGQAGFATPAPHPARRGSLLGDDGVQSSFHAISGHDLLRFVDPVARTVGQPPPLAAGDRSVTPPVPGTVLPGSKDVTLLLGQSATEDFTLDLPKNPTPLDLFFLVDVSTSMSTYIDNLKQNIHKVVDSLAAAHIDLRVGVGTLGTAPAQGEAPYPDSYVYPPTADPKTGQVTPGPTYRKPRIYSLIRPIGEVGKSLDKAINSINLETDPPVGTQHTGTFHEGQLLALEQMVTGSGVKSEQDDVAHSNTYSAVAPGQDARWRGNPDIRRIVVVASDEAFDAPYGTPQKPGSTVGAPKLDFRRTLGILNKARVGVFGITAGSPDSVDDMTTLARGTHTFAPPGGVSCGGDPVQRLKQGDPLVCSQEGDFSAIIGRVLSQLTDRQDVHLVAPTATPVLRRLDESSLAGLDVKRANVARFSVTVSCANVEPGTYEQDVFAMLRSYKVGTGRLFVTCVAPQAALPPVPVPPLYKPPIAPAVQPPVPPPAPPPAAQPQPQPNPNINPLTAGVTQEQQELQVALALQELADEQDNGEGVEQLAMVDRRKQEQVQALGVLAFAMTVCAGLGLSRLRTRPEVAVRHAR